MQYRSRVSLYGGFAKIAREHLNSASTCRKKLEPLIERLSTLTGDEAAVFQEEHLSPLEDEISDHCVITIVFCALAIEGYIYDYAARNLSDSFVDSHLDKLDIVSKWIVVPKLVTGKEFPKDTRGFQLLKQLVANRNFLAHNKSAPLFVYGERINNFPFSSSARKVIELVDTLPEKAEEAVSALDELALIMEDLDPNESASFDLDAPVGKRKRQLEQYGI